MIPKEFIQINPIRSPAAEIFISYRMAHEFRREAEYRQAMADYCQWYQSTAELHQQEAEKLKGDINIMGWFNRGRK
ncbi:MAG: hypothetical protein KME17_07380 [Cyanosarcina radialis HA8281-LM2]|jgi:hypothetical protein|nr:hypothetical protein [Cyanosarcina radialis HA8281-LM2]